MFLGAVLKTSYFFLSIMHKVKVQRSGELFVRNMVVIYFYMVMVKTYKVKKNSNKFQEIFQQETSRNFPLGKLLTTLAMAPVS